MKIESLYRAIKDLLGKKKPNQVSKNNNLPPSTNPYYAPKNFVVLNNYLKAAKYMRGGGRKKNLSPCVLCGSFNTSVFPRELH